MRTIAFLLLIVSSVSVGEDKIRVTTTLTELAWAAQKIGGKWVEAKPLLKGVENPHYVDAVPSFIQQVADSQIVCLVGLDLEVGWLPKVLERSGNAQVQPGGKGYCDLGSAVTPLEKPTGPVNRSMGDVHPGGNPHFTLSPTEFAKSATVIASTLSAIDPAHAKDYQKGLDQFKSELQSLQQSLLKKLSGRSPLMMEYHREFAYFFKAMKLRSFGSLEDKPGSPPSAGRIAQAASGAKTAGVKLLIASRYAPHHALERFEEAAGIPTLQVATSPVVGAAPSDYAQMMHDIVDQIVGKVKRP